MTETRPNAYTETWFELFLAGQDPGQTASEVTFLLRNLPRPPVTSLLDVCCGYGRHAGPLVEAGYRVLGVDRDPHVIDHARSLHASPNLAFQVYDMTRLAEIPGPFDAVICMWQSFGYHDAVANAEVLRQMASLVPAGGRVVLDIYNRDFFTTRQGTRVSEVRGVEVATTQRLEGDRLIVDLDYRGRRQRETFDWQVFTPEEITRLAGSVGLSPVLACTSFDEREAPSSHRPRMQMVFAKQ